MVGCRCKRACLSCPSRSCDFESTCIEPIPKESGNQFAQLAGPSLHHVPGSLTFLQIWLKTAINSGLFPPSSASAIGYLFTTHDVISTTGGSTKRMPAIPTLSCIITCYQSPYEPFVANGTTAKINPDRRSNLPCRRAK